MSGTKIIHGDNYECSNGDQYNVKDQATLIQAKELHLHPHEQRQPIIPHQPPSLDACFLGRDDELAKLLEQLQPGKVAAVCGPGGMGKSALAAQAVSKLDEARFPDGIIFHSFYHQPKVETALQAICQAFQVEAKAGLASTVRQVLAGRKALLILDGAEEADDLPAVLALRSTCGVLITSRKRADAQGFRLDLKPLEEQPAAAVFCEHSKAAADDESVAGICTILGGWPVGLRIAGRYCSSTGESAAGYLRWLEQEPFKELGDGEHQEENAALLLRRSVAQVSADAVQVLRLAGVLAFATIDLWPVAAVLFKKDNDSYELELRIRNALGELVNYGLLQKYEERWQISHALIHSYARTKLALSKETLERLADWYLAFCDTQSRAGLTGYACLDVERAHCLRLMEYCFASGIRKTMHLLLQIIDTYLMRQGYWAEWQAALEMLLMAARQVNDRWDEGWCLNELGLAYNWRGDDEKALACHEQCLSIAWEFGDRRQASLSLGGIASSYAKQGKHDMALQYEEESLSIARDIHDKKSEGTTLNNIARIYHDQDDYEQALHYYEQGLLIAQKVEYKLLEETILNNIAAIYYAHGDYAKAVEYNKQALAICREIGDRADETITHWASGITYKEMGDLAKAEEHIARAVQLAEAIDHPSLQQWREGLARVQAARQG